LRLLPRGARPATAVRSRRNAAGTRRSIGSSRCGETMAMQVRSAQQDERRGRNGGMSKLAAPARPPAWLELCALAAVGALVALAGGALVGLGGVPGLVLVLCAVACVGAIAVRQELLVGAVLGAAASIFLDWYPFPLPIHYIFHPDFAFAFAG